MKALTILQPWASLVANNKKKIETRSWATSYRGPIAIHAGMGKQHIDLCRQHLFWSNLWPYEEMEARYSFQEKIDKFLPLGAVIAIAELVDCIKIIGSHQKITGWCRGSKPIHEIVADLENGWFIHGNEFIFGDYTPGRYAWILDNVRRIDPVPAKGIQRLWNWEGNYLELQDS